MRFMSPWMRTIGGSPDDKCTSDAPARCAKVSSSVMSMHTLPCAPDRARRTPHADRGDPPRACCDVASADELRRLTVGRDASRYFGDGKLASRQAEQHGLHQQIAEGVIDRRHGDRSRPLAQPAVEQTGEEHDQTARVAERNVAYREQRRRQRQPDPPAAPKNRYGRSHT